MTELIAAYAESEFMFEIAAGSVGGFCSKALDYPFDTAKVLLQTQPPSTTATAGGASATPAQHEAAVMASLAAPRQRYTGTFDCLQQCVKNQGFASLYNGVGSRLMGSMAENAVCFWAYGTMKKQLLVLKEQQQQQQQQQQYRRSNGQRQQQEQPVQLSLFDLSIAGAGAGAVVSFVMTPVELIKCRLQVSSHLYKNSSWECFKQTLQTEGLWRGLYKGHLTTMYREVPGNFCWYLTYEMVCEALLAHAQQSLPTLSSSSSSSSNSSSARMMMITRKEDLPVQAHMTAGAAAGVMYWAAIYPIDAVKSVLQTSSSSGTTATTTTFQSSTAMPTLEKNGGGTTTTTTTQVTTIGNPPSFQQVLKQMYQQQGIRGLYRGFGVTALRAAPANAVLFAGYEKTVQFLKQQQQQS